jgi:hypothetical protein
MPCAGHAEELRLVFRRIHQLREAEVVLSLSTKALWHLQVSRSVLATRGADFLFLATIDAHRWEPCITLLCIAQSCLM